MWVEHRSEPATLASASSNSDRGLRPRGRGCGRGGRQLWNCRRNFLCLAVHRQKTPLSKQFVLRRSTGARDRAVFCYRKSRHRCCDVSTFLPLSNNGVLCAVGFFLADLLLSGKGESRKRIWLAAVPYVSPEKEAIRDCRCIASPCSFEASAVGHFNFCWGRLATFVGPYPQYPC